MKYLKKIVIIYFIIIIQGSYIEAETTEDTSAKTLESYGMFREGNGCRSIAIQ